MSKDKEKSKLAIILPIVFAFLGMTVLFHMISAKSVVGGIESFILSLKTYFFAYVIAILSVIAGIFVGQRLRNKRDNK